MGNSRLSVVIITFNEGKNIARCLASIKNIADEIIVIDSFSTDNTEAICKNFGVKFIIRKWEGYAKTKNYGNSIATFPFILSLDADEEVSSILKISLLNAKKTGLTGVYSFNRLTNYCGSWVHHSGWYPDTKIRLFPKTGMLWKGNFVHEELCFSNNKLMVTHLSGDLNHFSYYSTSEHLERIEKYAILSAEKMLSEGRNPSGFVVFFSPIFKFVRTWIFKFGILDGRAGYNIARFSAYSVRLKYLKLKQIKNTYQLSDKEGHK